MAAFGKVIKSAKGMSVSRWVPGRISCDIENVDGGTASNELLYPGL